MDGKAGEGLVLVQRYCKNALGKGVRGLLLCTLQTGQSAVNPFLAEQVDETNVGSYFGK